MDYVNQTFEGGVVELDGNTFENCVFNDVLFHFTGGPVNIKDCTINRFRFRFGGALASGLHALYLMFGTDGMLQIIRGFTERKDDGEIELLLRQPPA